MKKSNIEARRRTRRRFILLHWKLFYALYKKREDVSYKEWVKLDEHKRIAKKARELIGFSEKTASVDIVWPMYLTYKNYLTNLNLIL